MEPFSELNDYIARLSSQIDELLRDLDEVEGELASLKKRLQAQQEQGGGNE